MPFTLDDDRIGPLGRTAVIPAAARPRQGGTGQAVAGNLQLKIANSIPVVLTTPVASFGLTPIGRPTPIGRTAFKPAGCRYLALPSPVRTCSIVQSAAACSPLSPLLSASTRRQLP